jgi:hypothetical protein
MLTRSCEHATLRSAPTPARSLTSRYTPPMRLALAVLFAAAAGAGCSNSPPELRVVSAEVQERTAEGIVLSFTVEAENPNREPLPLHAVEYDLSLNGQRVFTGLRSAEATVRRYGTQTFTLPAALPLTLNPPLGSPEYVLSGKVEYVVPGALAETLFDVRVFRPSTGFSGRGTVNLDQLKPAEPEPKPGEPPPMPPPSDDAGPSAD